jgi:hypothetical protein
MVRFGSVGVILISAAVLAGCGATTSASTSSGGTTTTLKPHQSAYLEVQFERPGA